MIGTWIRSKEFESLFIVLDWESDTYMDSSCREQNNR